MPSLFEQRLSKTDIVKTLEKILKQENLTANFSDPKWKILNENENTKIVDVKFNKKKNEDNIYFLTFYFKKDSEKIEKTSFRLFETKIGEKLEKIRTCDLSAFEKSKKDNEILEINQDSNELEECDN